MEKRYFIRTATSWHELSEKRYHDMIDKYERITKAYGGTQRFAMIEIPSLGEVVAIGSMDTLYGKIKANLQSRPRMCVIIVNGMWYELWTVDLSGQIDEKKLYSVRRAAHGKHWVMLRKWAEEHEYRITNWPGGKV